MANVTRISDFDTWRPGYPNAIVGVYVAGTSTLANIYSDFALTRQISNPIVLLSRTDANGTEYGKFPQPVYVDVSFSLLVNSSDNTGVSTPGISSLNGQDASGSVITTTRGSASLALKDILDGVVDIRAYGAFSATAGASTSTATLNAAIGAAAAQGGGIVLLQSATVAVNPFTLPTGVRLRGQGVAATKITCQAGSTVVTIGGDGAGLEELTLDGLTAATSSIGVEGINKNNTVFLNCVVQSFQIGIRFKGGNNTVWRNLSALGCPTSNVHLKGDSNAGGGATGAAFQNFQWSGGVIGNSAGLGLVLECTDRLISNLLLEHINFSTNVGPALKVVGARNLTVSGCSWLSNLGSITVQDGSDASQVAINTVQQVYFRDGFISDGTVNFNNTCYDVQFIGMSLQNVSMNLSVPTYAVFMADCLFNATTTVTGDTTKLIRQRTADSSQQTAGVTTDANPITAWQYQMAPGETVLIEVKIIGRQRDGIECCDFWLAAGVNRPGATLAYSVMTTAFTVGTILTGLTSGAAARVIANTNTGASGTLTLRDITGVFVSGETIQDSNSGLARAGGTVTFIDSALDDAGVTTMRAKSPAATTYAATVDCLGGSLRVRLTGKVSKIVEWVVNVNLTRP